MLGMRKMDLTGRVFSRLTAIKEDGRSANGKLIMWLCQCECGNKTRVATADLNRGQTGSCGCLRKDTLIALSTTHGMSRTPTHNIWKSMMARCTCPTDASWDRYGGRGISVCSRWADPSDGFSSFLDDMGEKPAGLSLDRIDNEKGYAPENCRWATPKEQARNTRRNRLLTYSGETKCLSEWAESLGVSSFLIKDRLRLGWSVAEAIQGRGAA